MTTVVAGSSPASSLCLGLSPSPPLSACPCPPSALQRLLLQTCPASTAAAAAAATVPLSGVVCGTRRLSRGRLHPPQLNSTLMLKWESKSHVTSRPTPASYHVTHRFVPRYPIALHLISTASSTPVLYSHIEVASLSPLLCISSLPSFPSLYFSSSATRLRFWHFFNWQF